MTKLPIQIGVTGGIGSGKSTVCNIFNVLGVPTYDADTRAKWVMTHDVKLKKELSKEFGGKVFTKNGALNKSYLASIVFNNKERLNQLNAIVHPRVALDYKNWVLEHKQYYYLVKEAALLFESGSYQQLDGIMIVTAPSALRISRVLSRDKHRTEEEVLRILEKQMPESEKIERADYVVSNDESSLLTVQVIDLHKKFSQTLFH